MSWNTRKGRRWNATMAKSSVDDVQNDQLCTRSGRVNIHSALVSFLYDLLRDHLTAGQMERLVRNAHQAGDPILFTNGWLALYAADVAERLLFKEKEDSGNTPQQRSDSEGPPEPGRSSDETGQDHVGQRQA